MNYDCITLSGLTFYSYHGYFKEEKKLGNTYIIDIQIYTDFTKASKTDVIENTVDYTKVYQLIKLEFNKTSNLLEHLGYRILKSIFVNFKSVHEIEITVTKKSPPIGGLNDGVSIKMRKTSAEFLTAS